MEHRVREWSGRNEYKKRELQKWIKAVYIAHRCFHRNMTGPDPSSDEEAERRSNERPCEKLKQEHHDDRWVNYPQDGNEEVEYRYARFLPGTECY